MNHAIPIKEATKKVYFVNDTLNLGVWKSLNAWAAQKNSLKHCIKKSRIRETKHLSTDADSSIDTTVGWTKNTRKSGFFFKRKKSSKTQKLKNV